MDDRERGVNPAGTGSGQETVRVGGGPPSQDTPPTGYAAAPPPPYSAPPTPPRYAYDRAAQPVVRESQKRGIPILGPILLILAGVLFLLNTLEILPWGVWGSLWRLWPLVLIAIGLDMLFGRRNPLVSGLIVLGVMAAGLGWIFSSGGLEGWDKVARQSLSVPLAGSTSASVEINIENGELRLGSIPPGPNLLAEGTLEYPERGSAPAQEVEREGDSVRLKLDQHSGARFFPFFWDVATTWDVKLSQWLPLNLDVDVDSGNTDLNLRDLRVADLKLKVDSGNVSVTFPANAGAVPAEADIDSGNLTLYFPEGVAADIEANVDSGNVNTDSPFRSEGNRYLLEGHSGSPNHVILRLQVDSGNVNLRTSEQLP